MRRYLFLASAVLALASCQSDDFIGNTPGNEPNAATAISFDGETGKISRATSGADAATKLNKNFVVYGTKTVSDATSVVYNYYNVNYTAKDKDDTDKAWKYAGQTKNSLNTETGTETDNNQTLKYWDYSASQYDFVAFSFGEATQGEEEGKVKFTPTYTQEGSKELKSYTLTGKASELVKCYVADKATAKPSNTQQTPSNTQFSYKNDIQFNFHSLSSQVQLKIFEVIPGYSVKNVKFYSSNEDTKPSDVPTLYADDKKLPDENDKATVTVTFGDGKPEGSNDLNLAKCTWSLVEDASKSSSITFGDKLTNPTKTTSSNSSARKTRGNSESSQESDFLGITSSNASYSKVINIFSTNAGALTLKVDYTLVSDDGSNETIKVTGANVKIANEYTNWAENTKYIYVFKISDKTNGSTGGASGEVGLYPITFDAVVTEPTDGISSDKEFDIKKEDSSSSSTEDPQN